MFVGFISFPLTVDGLRLCLHPLVAQRAANLRCIANKTPAAQTLDKLGGLVRAAFWRIARTPYGLAATFPLVVDGFAARATLRHRHRHRLVDYSCLL